ncbi:MAG: hypothetical protein ACJ72W_26400 [Actinoallomurus sp.]
MSRYLTCSAHVRSLAVRLHRETDPIPESAGAAFRTLADASRSLAGSDSAASAAWPTTAGEPTGAAAEHPLTHHLGLVRDSLGVLTAATPPARPRRARTGRS